MVSNCAVGFYTPTVVALDKWTGGLAWHSGGLRTTMRRVGFKINTLAVVSRRAARGGPLLFLPSDMPALSSTATAAARGGSDNDDDDARWFSVSKLLSTV